MAAAQQQHSGTGATASKQGPLHTGRSWPHSGTYSPHCALQVPACLVSPGDPTKPVLRAPPHFPLLGSHIDPSAQTPGSAHNRVSQLHPKQCQLWMRRLRVSTSLSAITTSKKPDTCLPHVQPALLPHSLSFHFPCQALGHIMFPRPMLTAWDAHCFHCFFIYIRPHLSSADNTVAEAGLS